MHNTTQHSILSCAHNFITIKRDQLEIIFLTPFRSAKLFVVVVVLHSGRVHCVRSTGRHLHGDLPAVGAGKDFRFSSKF